MSNEQNTDDGADLVVTAGYVTVRTQVGAGVAYVDIPQGQVLPDDVSDEDRTRLVAAGSVGRRDGKPADSASREDAARAARPVPGEVEPDEIPADIIPGGTVEQIMEWVGDDLARARVARHEELAKGDKARATLLARLDKVKAAEETEPPTVPEHYDETTSPAAPGGVATPQADPGAGGGKPADGDDAGR
ncbi:hypothetical protein ACFUYE_05325 [Micromonospora humida]|uniref:hypothetical protein n=1 Tax=Micromonospora humida TaxID=2809018 RepID=UPI00366CE5B8